MTNEEKELINLCEWWINHYYTFFKARGGQMTSSEYRSFKALGYDKLNTIQEKINSRK